jgi:SPP1 gp7 family putative phage head morphogenesis protein
VQKHFEFGVEFTQPGAKQLDTAVKERWAGQNYSDRIWTDKTKLILQLDQLLSQNFVRGRGSREVAKDLAAKLETSYSNAQRLIRTETNYISNKATLKAYAESGIVQKYEFLATLDMRTSDICREMDGRTFTLKEGKVGINLPPLHPYCRSTTIPYFDDEEDTLRIARDKQGRSYIIDGKTKYKDWVQEHTSAGYAERVSKTLAKYKHMVA